MPKLSFRVNADTTPIKKFRSEIEQIEKTMLRIKGENFSFDHWIKEFGRLKNELEKKRAQIDVLKKDILTVNPIFDKKKFDSLNTQLSKSSKERAALIDDTIALSSKFGKAYDALVATLGKAQKVTDEVTARFIEQKQVVANLQSEVRSLNAEYRNANKADKVGIRSQITNKQKELEQQRITLNALKAEQEHAKLAVKGLSDETRNYEKVVGKVSGAQAEANLVFSRFENSLLKIGGLATLRKLVSDIVIVRGEFQKTQMAFETMLGSKEKADALMSQMIETAAKTPFDFQGVANGAKQLLAYGTEAKDVNETLVRLGNIASGLSIPLGDMVYLYGTTQVQGRLFATDVRQFMGRGIPLVKELASILGKTEQEINEMVTAGQIGFPEVEKVIKKMTDEGGQFYNLMQKQSATLSGQISNLGDAWNQMLNSIGEKTQGLTSTTISMATWIVESYDEIGQILKTLIVLYGTYKTALILNIALEKAQALQRLASIKGLTTMKMLTDMLTGSVTKLNVALAGKGFALIGSAAVASSILLLNWAHEQDKCTKAVEKFDKEQKASIEIEKKRKQVVENAISVASNEKKSTKERINAISVLKQMYKNIIPEYEKETFLLKNIADYKNKINEAEERSKRIGIKTKIVMLDKDIAKYEAGLREANKQGAGQATQGIMNTINNLKKERELYSGLLSDIGKEQVYSKTNSKTETQNKSYWEKQKKEANAALESIASTQKKLMDAGKFEGIDATTVKSYKDNVKKLKEAEKELKVYDSSSKQESQAEKLRQQQEKYNLLLDKQSLDRIRREEDLENQAAQARIDAMSDGFIKEQTQRKLNNKKEIQALERQKEDYIHTVIQAEREKFNANPANKGKTFNASSVKVDTSGWDTIINDTKTKQGLNEWEQREASMNEYLLKYGTFTQKKEALDKKYRDAIDKEGDLGKKNILQKEWEEAVSSLDMDKLKQEINWELVFGDLSKVSKKSLEQVKSQLKAFKDSAEYQNMTVEQKKVVDEALNNIQSTIIDKGGLLGDLPEQLDALRVAQEELAKAQEEYDKALENGTDAEKEAALKKKNNAEKNVQNAQTNVTKSADKTTENLISLADTITQLGNSSEMTLSQIGNLASRLIDTFTEAGSKIGGIVGAAFSLLDAIDKQGLDGFVKNIFSSVFNTSRSVWDTITFGAFSKITGSGDSDKTLEQDIEYLTQSNQDLKNALDNLSEKMDKASVADASDIYSVQKENILKLEANTREAMQRSGAAYSNGFMGIGGSHSTNYKIDKGMSASEWKRVSDIVGRSVQNASQFFQLSSEQMAKLAEDDTALYSKIKSLADDGYKDAAQYMDEYITYYKQLEELENAYNEKLTNTSFDSVRDSFKSALLDMKSDAKSFTDDFEKMMQNAIIESLMTKKYDKLIQDWYEEFAKAMENDGKIDKNEQGNLKNKWDDIVNKALAERDALKEAMGWRSDSDSTREASQKGIATASQDSVDENNGRLTVIQEHTYSINENVNRVATGIDTIATHAVNLSCLTNIDKTMQSILSMRDASLTHLSNIDSHTSRLEAIEASLASVKNGIDTLNTKGITIKR